MSITNLMPVILRRKFSTLTFVQRCELDVENGFLHVLSAVLSVKEEFAEFVGGFSGASRGFV
jgi:hypothetical protein